MITVSYTHLPDGTLRVDSSVPERAEYEQQIEALQDDKRTLYERYLMGEIDLNTYKAVSYTHLPGCPRSIDRPSGF